MEFIKLQIDNQIAVLTIDREKALNALNEAVIEELGQVIDSISADTVRCVIVRGAGDKAFVAGADIGQMSRLTKKEAEAFARKGNAVFRKLETLPVPTIAAVGGFALGGGCELAMCCDIRLAADTAVFAQPEAGLGITPGFGGTQRLPRIVGVAKAKELIYTGGRIKAQEALAIGLVNAVYPAEQLMEEALKLAEKIARNAPIAVRAAKESICRGLHLDMDAALGVEESLFGGCFETEDQQAAMAAFLEKRKPDAFVNR